MEGRKVWKANQVQGLTKLDLTTSEENTYIYYFVPSDRFNSCPRVVDIMIMMELFCN